GSAGDLRQQKDLAVGLDRLEQRVLVDLTVDGDRHPFVQMRADPGVEGGELIEELLDGRRRESKLGDAPRELREVPDQNDSRHAGYFAAAAFSFRAFSTLGGDIGSSVKRMPVAASIALAMA